MATAAEVQEEIIEVKTRIRQLEEQLQNAPDNEQLNSRLTAETMRLAALQQKEVLLLGQQAGQAAAGAPEVASLIATQLEAQVMQLAQLMQLLLNDRLRPRSSSTSKHQRDRRCREAAIAYYFPRLDEASTTLRCMLLDEELDAAEVVAAHIYQLHWGQEFADHLGLDVNSAGNLLLVQKAAEKRFDDFQWTLKPLVPTMGQGPEGQPRSQQEFKVLVLDPALLNGSSNQHFIAGHVSKKTWSQVHGRLLVFAEGEGMPSRRACALHATRALQHAAKQGWTAGGHLSEADVLVEEAAYAASPTCDASRLSQFFKSAAAAWDVAQGSDEEGLSD